MLGAIIGDMVGSNYEFNDSKKPTPKTLKLMDLTNRMTDDSYLTLAVAKVLTKYYPFNFSEEEQINIQEDLRIEFKYMVEHHKTAGFGGTFYFWALKDLKDMKPYNSCANGSAMRISAVGWMANNLTEVQYLSLMVSEITHNHPDGLKGAEAIATAIFMALHGYSKEEIGDYMIHNYYPRIVDIDYDKWVKEYKTDLFCEGSCPEAIYCFLHSNSLQDAIVKAVCMGGDSDTIACMAGAIAEAYYNKNSISKLEQMYMDFCIEDEYLDIIKNMHKKIGSKKFIKE